VHEEAAAGIPQADTDPASDDAGRAAPPGVGFPVVLSGQAGRADAAMAVHLFTGRSAAVAAAVTAVLCVW